MAGMMRSQAVIAVTLLAIASAPWVVAQGTSEFTTERFPYAAFDRLPKTTLGVAAGSIDMGFAPGDTLLSRQSLMAWIETSARAVSVYFGRFPANKAIVLIIPVSGKGIGGGQSFGFRGSAIRLQVGRDSTERDLTEDWQAVHEMIHFAVPDVDERHLWLSEGLAVYVESIARVQAGQLPAEKIWAEFVRDMPQGLPQAGDRGLDHTPTWGRRYWGGALFCLLADVEIRKRTGGKKGLQEALRGLIAAGGSNEKSWPIDRIIKIADEATGVPVLRELYAQMRDEPTAPDLVALWRDLGISVTDGRAVFSPDAPLAKIREAITAAPAGVAAN